MDIQSIIANAAQMFGGSKSGGGSGGKKPPDKDIISDEMKVLYKKNVPYDNKSAKDILNSVGKKSGLNPGLLFSSAFQEGMNKAIVRPGEHSEAYDMAREEGNDLKDYPVDAFYNYGVDKFGDNYDKIKKYLPEGFEGRYKMYNAINEQNEPVKTAAFKTNEDALMAKAAMMHGAMDEVNDYATQKNINLDEKARNYFTLARYNSKPENYRIMMDEYMNAKDKNKFIDEGLTSRKGVHKNIAPRLSRMKLANDLLSEQDLPIPTASQVVATK